MRSGIQKKLSLLAASVLAVLSIAGCANNEPHGGLVPDVSGPSTIESGVTDSYSISASSVTDYPLAYGINWGDGTKPVIATNVSSGSSVSAEHAWAKPGTYTITATATNGHGESGFSAYTVQVNPPPPPEQEEAAPPEAASAAPESIAAPAEPPAPVPDKPAPPLTVIISDEPLPPVSQASGSLKMVEPPQAAMPANPAPAADMPVPAADMPVSTPAATPPAAMTPATAPVQLQPFKPVF